MAVAEYLLSAKQYAKSFKWFILLNAHNSLKCYCNFHFKDLTTSMWQIWNSELFSVSPGIKHCITWSLMTLTNTIFSFSYQDKFMSSYHDIILFLPIPMSTKHITLFPTQRVILPHCPWYPTLLHVQNVLTCFSFF